MTSNFSMGTWAGSMDVCHEIRTEAGVRKVTVMFSGAAGKEPKVLVNKCGFILTLTFNYVKKNSQRRQQKCGNFVFQAIISSNNNFS